MRIDWDIPTPMDDDIVLRADIYRPVEDGRYPVILTYGPYGKGLPFQVGYPDQWRIMTEQHPDVTAGSTNKYESWEVVGPEKWVPTATPASGWTPVAPVDRPGALISSHLARRAISTTASIGWQSNPGVLARLA
jgi:hypothetical protein